MCFSPPLFYMATSQKELHKHCILRSLVLIIFIQGSQVYKGPSWANFFVASFYSWNLFIQQLIFEESHKQWLWQWWILRNFFLASFSNRIAFYGLYSWGFLLGPTPLIIILAKVSLAILSMKLISSGKWFGDILFWPIYGLGKCPVLTFLKVGIGK